MFKVTDTINNIVSRDKIHRLTGTPKVNLGEGSTRVERAGQRISRNVVGK